MFSQLCVYVYFVSLCCVLFCVCGVIRYLVSRAQGCNKLDLNYCRIVYGISDRLADAILSVSVT